MTTYWVYILECENGTYYTGYTIDLNKRFQEHLIGSDSCKYTRSFKPIKIAQSWQLATKSEALRMEKKIKQLTKKQKEALILCPEKAFNYPKNKTKLLKKSR